MDTLEKNRQERVIARHRQERTRDKVVAYIIQQQLAYKIVDECEDVVVVNDLEGPGEQPPLRDFCEYLARIGVPYSFAVDALDDLRVLHTVTLRIPAIGDRIRAILLDRDIQAEEHEAYLSSMRNGAVAQ